MRTQGYVYKCDMCAKEQFVSINDHGATDSVYYPDDLLRFGIHKCEITGDNDIKHICDDCYVDLIHFIMIEHKECGVPKMCRSEEE